MRMIGHLDSEANARAFGDYLLTQGIENEIESDKGGAWAVWIHAEEELERAKGLLAAYLQNSADPKYRDSAQAAQGVRDQKKNEQAAYERKIRGSRNLFRPVGRYGFGPVTYVLIFISVAVYVLHQVLHRGDDESVMQLFITKFDIVGNHVTWERGLPEIRHGEIWRLFTPVLLHFSIIHILCNMLWMVDLGSMIEGRQKSWLLAVMVLAMALVSNVAQYLTSGPFFGGMSGVVYGLLGYIWIRGKLDPGSGLYLHSSTVTMMIVWFFACLVGLVGQVANTAHAAGLLMGMAWGWLSSLRRH